MQINKNYIIITLVVLCTIAVWLNINNKNVKSGKDFDALVIELEQQIAVQNLVIERQVVYSDSITALIVISDRRYDSLINLEQEIIYIHDKEISTLPTASDHQLDSIIRSSW